MLVSGQLGLAATVTIPTTPNGDAGFYWNSKYGLDAYTTGQTAMGVGLYMGAPYGNDYTIGIMMFDLSALAGKMIDKVELSVFSNGFGTGYYYGSAAIGWLNTGSMTLTGNVVADGLGAPAKSRPGGWTFFNTDVPGSEAAGWIIHDFTAQIQSDITAGRPYSVFVLTGSRDTSGSLQTAESGQGPLLIATVPEPCTPLLLTLIGGVAGFRRKRD